MEGKVIGHDSDHYILKSESFMPEGSTFMSMESHIWLDENFEGTTKL